MDWQQQASLVIVAAVAALFLWNALRRRPVRFGRDNHCGCSSQGARQTVVFHARKGGPSRIIVKSTSSP